MARSHEHLLLARWRILSHNAFQQQCIAAAFTAAVNPLYVTWNYIKTLHVEHRDRGITISLITAKLIETSQSDIYISLSTLRSSRVCGKSGDPANRGIKARLTKRLLLKFSPTRRGRSSFPVGLFSICAPDGNGLLGELFAFAKQNGHTASIRRDVRIPDSTKNSAPLVYGAYAFNPKVLRCISRCDLRRCSAKISIEQF